MERALAVFEQMDLPAQVALRRAFQLDDLGAQVGQQPRCRRPGQILREIDDRHAGQQFRWGCSCVGHAAS